MEVVASPFGEENLRMSSRRTWNTIDRLRFQWQMQVDILFSCFTLVQLRLSFSKQSVLTSSFSFSMLFTFFSLSQDQTQTGLSFSSRRRQRQDSTGSTRYSDVSLKAKKLSPPLRTWRRTSTTSHWRTSKWFLSTFSMRYLKMPKHQLSNLCLNKCSLSFLQSF